MSPLLNLQRPEKAAADVKQLGKKLVIIDQLLYALHSSEISYCHWKSSEHLDASMTGDTDLDILFGYEEKEKLELLLPSLGFKKLKSISQKQYKDIEDFIGLDVQSGKLVHVHAHFKLTLGEPYLKSYQLDLEGKILDSRIFDEQFGIYRIQPAFELLLLYFRESLKIRKRDIIKMIFGKKVDYPEHLIREYEWLKKRCTEKEIKKILRYIVADDQSIFELVSGPFNRRQILKLSYLVRREFRGTRFLSSFQAQFIRWYREVSVKVYRKTSLLLNRPIVTKRINPQGGLSIAIIGADGSGKSTAIASLNETFKAKLDVYRIYLGRGDGKMSLSRKVLFFFKKRFFPSKAKKPGSKQEKPVVPMKRGFMIKLYKGVEALIVANEKRRNLKFMRSAVRKGMLVICDRFPQNQIMGFNDGPLLHRYLTSKNPLLRMIGKMEARIYASAEKNPPQLLFKLIADAKVVEARKPNETTLDVLEAKIDGIRKLQFNNSCRVITIDASQPLDQVLQNIRREIWKAYP